MADTLDTPADFSLSIIRKFMIDQLAPAGFGLLAGAGKEWNQMADFKKMIEGKSAEELQALAKERGLDISGADIERYLKGDKVELSAEELAQVSGGWEWGC